MRKSEPDRGRKSEGVGGLDRGDGGAAQVPRDQSFTTAPSTSFGARETSPDSGPGWSSERAPQFQSFHQVIEAHVKQVHHEIAERLESVVTNLSAELERRHPQLGHHLVAKFSRDGNDALLEDHQESADVITFEQEYNMAQEHHGRVSTTSSIWTTATGAATGRSSMYHRRRSNGSMSSEIPLVNSRCSQSRAFPITGPSIVASRASTSSKAGGPKRHRSRLGSAPGTTPSSANGNTLHTPEREPHRLSSAPGALNSLGPGTLAALAGAVMSQIGGSDKAGQVRPNGGLPHSPVQNNNAVISLEEDDASSTTHSSATASRPGIPRGGCAPAWHAADEDDIGREHHELMGTRITERSGGSGLADAANGRGSKASNASIMSPGVRASNESGLVSSGPMDLGQVNVLPFWIEADQQITHQTASFFNTKISMSSVQDINEMVMPENMTEQERCIQDIVWHPSSARRLVWDFLGILLIAYDVAVVPLQFFDTMESKQARLLGWISRIFWTLDLPTSFFTGYLLRDGDVELRLPKIARRYCRTWLFVDVAVVLFDWIDLVAVGGLGEVVTARVGKTVRVMRLMRSVRLVRIAKLPVFAGTWFETTIRSERVQLLASISKLVVLIIIMIHFFACMWYGIGRANDQDQGWVHIFDADEDLVYRYTTSFHWSLTQFTGTMEVVPSTGGERLFAVIVLLVAFIVSATFISNITSAMTRLSMLSGSDATMFANLRDYLLDHGLSRKLMVRVQRNAHYSLLESRQNCPEKDVALLHLISEPLRMEIHFELHAPVLRTHPLFRRIQDEAPAALRKLCHTAVCTHFLSQGDILFMNGEVKDPPEMYFVTKGKMVYKHSNYSTLYVDVGCWAAEPVLWCSWQHCGIFKARTECELLVLSANNFRAIASTSQNPNLNLGRYAIEYVKLINQELFTDVEDKAWDAMQVFWDAGTAATLKRNVFGRGRTESTLSLASMFPGWITGHPQEAKDGTGGGRGSMFAPVLPETRESKSEDIFSSEASRKCIE